MGKPNIPEELQAQIKAVFQAYGSMGGTAAAKNMTKAARIARATKAVEVREAKRAAKKAAAAARAAKRKAG